MSRGPFENYSDDLCCHHTPLTLFDLNTSRLCEGDDVQDDKVVTELRSELWEKERKLTDIRLEALSSAHRLEQLQEAMTSMQVGGRMVS